MFGGMIRIRRDGLSSRLAGTAPKHVVKIEGRAYSGAFTATRISWTTRCRAKTKRAATAQPWLRQSSWASNAGNSRKTLIFANNPFLDGLFEWMDSPEGQQSIEVRDVLWNLLEDVQLDAKQRKLIWPDAERLDFAQSTERVLKKYPDFPRNDVEEF